MLLWPPRGTHTQTIQLLLQDLAASLTSQPGAGPYIYDTALQRAATTLLPNALVHQRNARITAAFSLYADSAFSLYADSAYSLYADSAYKKGTASSGNEQ